MSQGVFQEVEVATWKGGRKMVELRFPLEVNAYPYSHPFFMDVVFLT